MPTPGAIDITATMHLLAGRKPVKEVILAQAEIIEAGATEFSLTWERIRVTLHQMATLDEKITPGSLIQKARTSPPQSWLDSRGVGALGLSDDVYFERIMLAPQGYFGASREERQKLDRTYDRAKIQPRDDGPLSPSLSLALSKLKELSGKTLKVYPR